MDDEEMRAREEDELVDSSGNAHSPNRDENGPVTTGEVRIAAVEAAVAAGLAPSTGHSELAAPVTTAPTAAVELPDWTDPPTGQVPRVLYGEGEGVVEPVLRGPTWREGATDWEEEVDLSFLTEGESDLTATIAGQVDVPPEGVPNPFEFAELDAVTSGTPVVDDAAWAPLFDEVDEEEEAPLPGALGERQRRAAHRRKAHRARRGRPVRADEKPAVAVTARIPVPAPRARPPKRRNALVATATGLGVGVVAILCFLGGTITSLALVVVAVTLAAGEAFGSLRRAGYRPAAPIGLLAVPAMVIGAYLHGLSALVLFAVLAFVLTAIWFLRFHADTSVVGDIGATLLVVTWIGFLGGFGGLLLAPHSFPHRHGIAYLVAAIAITVAHDVGSYAVGSRFGRHKLAPSISPHKTIEGLVGGTVLALVVAALIGGAIHPLNPGRAVLIGLAVVVLAPLGDLVESLVKRNLGVKDMGHLLPAHGGVLDRVDALLFVLPATYYIVRLLNLG